MKRYYHTNNNGRIIVVESNGDVPEQWIYINDKWSHRQDRQYNISDFDIVLYDEITKEEVERILFVGNL